ncbi:hypothetical protein L7F22_018638 [Adiantum nelumboides]|nr:hypothetical protein [Adiantum nelumboides]
MVWLGSFLIFTRVEVAENGQLDKVKQKLDMLRQSLKEDFQAFLWEFEALWGKLIMVIAIENVGVFKLRTEDAEVWLQDYGLFLLEMVLSEDEGVLQAFPLLLDKVKQKLDRLKKSLEEDFQAFLWEFQALWEKLIKVTTIENVGFFKLSNFMDCLHEEVQDKVEIDGPMSYKEAVVLANGRTKKIPRKILMKRKARQGLLGVVMPNQVHAVVAKPILVQREMHVQEKPRVLWLQRDGVVPMPRMPARETPIVEDVQMIPNRTKDVLPSSIVTVEAPSKGGKGQRVWFTDEVKAVNLEELPKLETKEEIEPSDSSSMDADTSCMAELSQSRYDEFDLDAWEEQGEMKTVMFGEDQVKPTSENMQGFAKRDVATLLMDKDHVDAIEIEFPSSLAEHDAAVEEVLEVQLIEADKQVELIDLEGRLS